MGGLIEKSQFRGMFTENLSETINLSFTSVTDAHERVSPCGHMMEVESSIYRCWLWLHAADLHIPLKETKLKPFQLCRSTNCFIGVGQSEQAHSEQHDRTRPVILTLSTRAFNCNSNFIKKKKERKRKKKRIYKPDLFTELLLLEPYHETDQSSHH